MTLKVKKMTNDYWEKRVLKNEAKAQKYAAQSLKRQRKLYKSTYKRIAKDIESLALELLEKGTYGKLSRSELWQYKKYIDLQQAIGKILENQSGQQVSLTTAALDKCFFNTIGSTLEELNVADNIAYTILNDTQVNQVLNTAWSGKHYSERIYGTNSRIAERIKNDITDMVVMGKNTETIKKQLMSDLNVSYSYADRLVRTEASHIYNEAAKAAYKEAKVEEVEILVEDDDNLCEECESLRGTYTLGSEPRLPAHPNCRCCYAPVVDLNSQE